MSKVKVERKIICEGCNGKGGENVEECKKCKGKGIVMKMV